MSCSIVLEIGQDLLIKATDFEMGVPSIVFEAALLARVHQAVDGSIDNFHSAS
jgi:hypothetical protein